MKIGDDRSVPRYARSRYLNLMKLRPYQSSDLEEVIQLWWDSWHSSSGYKHPRPISDWRKRWHNLEQSHHIVVVESCNDIIAFAALNLQEHILSQLFVSPLWKRKGIGKKLIHWVASQCPEGFSLKTAANNQESRAFYEALGMLETSRNINDFNGREEIEYTA